MTHFAAAQVTYHVQDDCIYLGFDLAGTAAGYVLISVPEAGMGAETTFFDADHYVEVLDQLHGRFGGLRHVRVHGDREVRLTLNYTVPGVGSELVITAADPFPREVLIQLDYLVR